MDHRSRLDLISDLQSKIHRSLAGYIREDQHLSIVDFPDIKNCGDSAIWVGEIAYLRRHFNGKTPDYVSRLRDYAPSDLRRKAPDGPIFIHGGGNFGDIWLAHQTFRERVLADFPDRQVVQFPQSIHFNDPRHIDAAARAIDRHGNFILLVRDAESLEFSRKHFNCEVRLCPDMAFAIGPIEWSRRALPVLAMLREDSEKVARACEWPFPDIPKEDWITEDEALVTRTKRIAWAGSFRDLRPAERRFRMLDAAANQRLFDRGIAQIGRADALVTDRLHVHICALLLGRPHAVLDNSYGKIRRFMGAFSGGTDVAYRASSIRDGVAWAREQAALAQAVV